MANEDPYKDNTFDARMEERAAALISRGINPYDFDEAMAHGVEWIPESVEEARDVASDLENSAKGGVSAFSGRVDKYAGFLKDVGDSGIDFRSYNFHVGAKSRLLAKYFPGRFGPDGSQPITDYEGLQISKIFDRVVEYARKQK
jgi:hypothetical protein